MTRPLMSMAKLGRQVTLAHVLSQARANLTGSAGIVSLESGW